MEGESTDYFIILLHGEKARQNLHGDSSAPVTELQASCLHFTTVNDISCHTERDFPV